MAARRAYVCNARLGASALSAYLVPEDLHYPTMGGTGHVDVARPDVAVRRSLEADFVTRSPMALGWSGGKSKEQPVLVGEPFVAAAAAGRSSMVDDLSCPPDPLRAPRVVLLFTGHLRGTCTPLPSTPRPIDAIVNQTRWCREAFGSGCHAFLHTWSTLEPEPIPWDMPSLARLKNLSMAKGHRKGHTPRSSAACAEEVRAAVGARHLTVAIETQVPQVPYEQLRPWGHFRELVDLNMRMQMAGIGDGLALAARHVPCYDALVRMRADVGSLTGSAKGLFMLAQSWRNVRSRAEQVARGGVPANASWAREVVTCGWPRVKRTDFCLWSAPPAPLAGVVGALLGDSFQRTVHEHNCSGFLRESNRSDELVPISPPVASENVLLCAMREVNASWSRRADRKPWPTHHGESKVRTSELR